MKIHYIVSIYVLLNTVIFGEEATSQCNISTSKNKCATEINDFLRGLIIDGFFNAVKIKEACSNLPCLLSAVESCEAVLLQNDIIRTELDALNYLCGKAYTTLEENAECLSNPEAIKIVDRCGMGELGSLHDFVDIGVVCSGIEQIARCYTEVSYDFCGESAGQMVQTVVEMSIFSILELNNCTFTTVLPGQCNNPHLSDYCMQDIRNFLNYVLPRGTVNIRRLAEKCRDEPCLNLAINHCERYDKDKKTNKDVESFKKLCGKK